MCDSLVLSGVSEGIFLKYMNSSLKHSVTSGPMVELSSLSGIWSVICFE